MEYPTDRNIHRPRHINQQERPYFVTGRTYFGLPYFETPKAKEALLQAVRLAARNYSLVVDAWVVLDNHYHLLFRPLGSAAPEELPCNGGFRRYRNKQACHYKNDEVTHLCVTEESDGVTPLGATRPFSIGKVMGTIHGKSSSLLKEVSRSDNFSCYYDWWETKYWESIRRENINLYGRRSVLAEKKHSEEFRRLLREGTPRELVDFVCRLERVWYQYTDRVVRDERDYFTHFNYIHQNPVKHGYVERMSDYQFSSVCGWVEDAGKEWLADCFRRYPVVDFEPEMGDFD